MKKSTIIIALIALLGIALQNCLPDDKKAPEITLLGVNGKTLRPTQNDTVVILQSKYLDPGVKVQDNKSQNLVAENNLSSLLNRNTKRLSRAGNHAITYTAKDEAGNVGTKDRKLNVVNISEVFTGTRNGSYYNPYKYRMYKRQTTHLDNSMVYDCNLTANSTICGAIDFPKVYNNPEGTPTAYKVTAHLWSENYASNFYSQHFGYLGKRNNENVPFYEIENGIEGSNITYQEAKNIILSFEYLKINEMTFDNGTIIKGKDYNGVPLSKIEYNPANGDIKTIKLVYTIQRADGRFDEVTEEYQKLFDQN